MIDIHVEPTDSDRDAIPEVAQMLTKLAPRSRARARNVLAGYCRVMRLNEACVGDEAGGCNEHCKTLLAKACTYAIRPHIRRPAYYLRATVRKEIPSVRETILNEYRAPSTEETPTWTQPLPQPEPQLQPAIEAKARSEISSARSLDRLLER